MSNGVKISELQNDDVITGTEKILISDDGSTKYATVDQITGAIDEKVTMNTTAIEELTEIVNNFSTGGDVWSEFVE